VNRRHFMISSSAAAALAWLGEPPQLPAELSHLSQSEVFTWAPPLLHLDFAVENGCLRQGAFLPADYRVDPKQYPFTQSRGPEVALQCTGENSIDPAMKQAIGNPGLRLSYRGKQEHDSMLVLEHVDEQTGLKVESFYQSFAGLPVLRRHTRISNVGKATVGVEYLSSAMLHGLADPLRYDNQLRIHVAYNSWMSEGQWHTLRPSEMGFVENERTSWSEAAADGIGTWSTEKYLAMAGVENKELGLTTFWQIEHNGSWHWEISNASFRGNQAEDVYAYLGGPDALHAQAWKQLEPGAVYETVPVAVGCVRGGFEEMVAALTQYRRSDCVRPRPDGNRNCPVIFNDYMNCLEGDPTAEKETPLIAAAAAMGCEYFVIDAGWYAEKDENWSETVGLWQPAQSRWPKGLKYTLDQIRSAGMIPGLWLEPEVAGMHSPLAQKPDSWFFMRHGRRVIKNSRLLLDFRNPDVRAYLDGVVHRLVKDYGAGYIKMDYNTDGLEGTEIDAESFGQGLLQHNRALLAWLDAVLERYPELIIENCGSGGGRMDYAMLSRLQLQSCSDQEEYLRFPAIATGASAAVLPEQLAVWSYPTERSDAEAASFNMVNAMLLRIHQSGHLAQLTLEAKEQVKQGLFVYKSRIRRHIANATPFYPLGMPDVTDHQTPIALGMRGQEATFMAVWRLGGLGEVQIPSDAREVELLYPTNLGISVRRTEGKVIVRFPKPQMGCILSLRS
jgi:alpha-galactosidase